MTKILIILTLFGCDDAVSRCDLLQQVETAYISEESCQAAAETLLEASLDRPYPTLVTQCATPDDTMEFVESVSTPEQVAAVMRQLQPAIN